MDTQAPLQEHAQGILGKGAVASQTEITALPIPACRIFLFSLFSLFLFSQATETFRVDRGDADRLVFVRSYGASKGKPCGQSFFCIGLPEPVCAHGATEIAAVWHSFCGDLLVARDCCLGADLFFEIDGVRSAARSVGEESLEQESTSSIRWLYVVLRYVRHVMSRTTRLAAMRFQGPALFFISIHYST